MKFRPLEALLLIRERQATIPEMLRVTFFDLVDKQVLKVTELPPSSPDAETEHHISEGPALQGYKATPIEHIFVNIFRESPGIKVTAKNLGKMTRRSFWPYNQYTRKLTNHAGLAPYLKQSWFQQIFGGASINEEGRRIANTIIAELQGAKAEIESAIEADTARAKKAMEKLGPYLWLIPGLKLDGLLELDKAFSAMANKPGDKDHISDSGCGGDAGIWYGVASVFDSGHHDGGHGGHGDSGCGGGSGCGGDSGCGGSGCGGGGCGGGGCGGGCGGD